MDDMMDYLSDESAIAAVSAGQSGDPFSVLGLHGTTLRALLPGASGVAAIGEDGSTLADLQRVDHTGIFVGELPAHSKYPSANRLARDRPGYGGSL